MTDNEFWTIVADIDWELKCRSNKPYDSIKISLMKSLGSDKCNEMHDKHMEMRKKLNSSGHFHYCCDSWVDTLDHTIGLGKEEFDCCCKDPSLILKRYDSGDYVESFYYCIPTSYDFAALTVDKMASWARRNVESIDKALEDKGLSFLHTDLQRLRELHAPAIANDFNELKKFVANAQETGDLATSAASNYAEFMKKLKVKRTVGWKNVVLNLLSDAAEVVDLLS